MTSPDSKRISAEEQEGTATDPAKHSQPDGTSTIELTRRSDLSLLYRVVRRVLRPLRPNLVRPGKPQPPGSHQLSAPKKRDCEIVESQLEGVWQYTLRPNSTPAEAKGQADADRQSKHRIYFFNGGGFQSPPSSQHWVFLTELAKRLSYRTAHSQRGNKLDPQIIVISYPLAPNSPADESLPQLQKWLSRALQDADAHNDRVTLMGDSSGGNIALSLGFWAVENYVSTSSPMTQQKQQPQDRTDRASPEPGFPLASVLAISPAVDLRNVNDEMHEADRHDPILTVSLTSRVARAWASNPSRHLADVPDGPRPLLAMHPQVSPLLNDDAAFEALATRGVRVHGVVGTHDVLAPDALLFMRKCERCRVRGSWLVWDGQMHCFPLTAGKGVLGLREGQDATKWIEDVIAAHEF